MQTVDLLHGYECECGDATCRLTVDVPRHEAVHFEHEGCVLIANNCPTERGQQMTLVEQKEGYAWYRPASESA